MDDVVERIGDPELPDYLVVVSTPKTNGWERSDGKPGFVEWRIFDSIGVRLPSGVLVFTGGYGQATVESYDDATPISSGSVKWDGCANFSVGEVEGDRLDCLAHVCGPEQLAALGNAMLRAYEIAAEIVGVEG